MHNKTIYRCLLSSLGLMAGVLAVPAAQAQFTPGTTLYSTDFVGENNSVPADWDRFFGDGNRMDINNNRFYWRRESGGNSSGFFGRYVGSYESIPSYEWVDYRVETVFRAGRFDSASSRPAGIVLRWQNDSGPANGNKAYLGQVFNNGEGSITLMISKDFNNTSNHTGDAGGTVLTSQSFSFDWANNTFYKLSFEAAGNRLTLVFSNMDETQVFSITTTDDSYAKGVPGMRTYMSSGGFNWQTEWDSVRIVSVIPEPATIATLFGGAVLLFAFLSRQRRR